MDSNEGAGEKSKLTSVETSIVVWLGIVGVGVISGIAC